MYVDDGGDPGLNPKSPTRHFVLSGLVLHELRWRQFADSVLELRRRIRSTYGLPIRTEIHAAEYISRGGMNFIPRYNRLAILQHFTDHLALQGYLSVTNVVVDKAGKPDDYDVFTSAWRALFQRFENTLNHQNFPGPRNPEDKGMVFADNTDGGKLTRLVRRMAVHNPIPNRARHVPGYRNIPIVSILEDPSLRDSRQSYFIQAADLCAYWTYQLFAPNAYIHSKTGRGYFHRLDPILNKRASASRADGIVML